MDVQNMSYDAASLTTSDIKWLGVRPSDLDRYSVPAECRLDLTPEDIDAGAKLLKEDSITKNPEWVRELELMMRTKQKAEIRTVPAPHPCPPAPLHARPGRRAWLSFSWLCERAVCARTQRRSPTLAFNT